MTHYDRAAAVAAQIVNLYGGDEAGAGKALLFGKILFLVLHEFHEIRQEAATPSEN